MTFPYAALVAMALFAAAYAFAPLRLPHTVDSAAAPATPPGPPLNVATRLVVTVVAGGFIGVAALLVIGFPRGYEANAYHLPSAVNFFRDGSLHIWDNAYLHTLPANASLWDGFWLRLLPERFVAVVNLPLIVRLAALPAVPLLGCRPVGGRAHIMRHHNHPFVRVLLDGNGRRRGRCRLRAHRILAGLVPAAIVSELVVAGGSGQWTCLRLQTLASGDSSTRRAVDPVRPRPFGATAARHLSLIHISEPTRPY